MERFEQKPLLSFKDELTDWDWKNYGPWLRNIKADKLTRHDREIWQEFKKIHPGEEDGAIFLEKTLASYADALYEEANELEKIGADMSINRNSREFHHFMANKYMVDSANIPNMRKEKAA